MVQGCPAKAVSLVHISSILQKELTDNQGTLEIHGNQTEHCTLTSCHEHPKQDQAWSVSRIAECTCRRAVLLFT